MNHPNQVTVKTNQDIFRSSFNPKDGPTLQVLGELPVDETA
jgi:hypothetical protein